MAIVTAVAGATMALILGTVVAQSVAGWPGAATLAPQAANASSATGSTAPQAALPVGAGPAHMAAPTGFFNGWFVSDQSGWVAVPEPASGQAALIKTEDGGSTWRSQLTLQFPRLFQRDMSFLDSRHGFVTSLEPAGKVFKAHLYATSDGVTWVSRSLPASVSATLGTDFISESDGWIIAPRTASRGVDVYRSHDGGRSWSALTGSGLNPIDHIEGVRFSDQQHGWLAGWRPAVPHVTSADGPLGTPLLYSTGDGGASWQAHILPSVAGLTFPAAVSFMDTPRFSAGGDGVAVATIGGNKNASMVSYESRDGGQTWAATGLVANASAWATGDAMRVVTARQSSLVASTDRGRTAGALTSMAEARRVLSMQFVSSQVGFAFSYSDTTRDVVLSRTSDGGKSWTLLPALRY
jgi:photosystem II stability/assembly factor-like uncharacterized protein